MDYISITDNDREEMLKFMGLSNIDELFNLSIPENVKVREPLKIPKGISEYELITEVENLADENFSLNDYVSFLGGGAYDHFIPKIVDAIISLPGFYTPYTPYQPEVSQGILQALFEYQSMICEITGLDIANASLYDGSTSVAEAALLAHDVTGKNEVLVSDGVHPEYRAVLDNYTKGLGIKVSTIPLTDGQTDISIISDRLNENYACVIMQQPNFFGYLEDMVSVSEIIEKHPALFIASVDPISLGILKAPAEYGVDVVVGEGQSLGNNISFGGPYLGIFACRQQFLRRVPGHLISAAKDTKGRTGYVLTLQTREQHIKRERATSNICTSEVLNAIAAAVYLSYLGPSGLFELAELCLQKAHYAEERLREIDFLEPFSNAPFFKEFAFKSKKPVREINEHLLAEGIIGGLDVGMLNPELKDTVLFCINEKRTREEIDKLVDVMRMSGGYYI